jgi:hypothetical protein
MPRNRWERTIAQVNTRELMRGRAAVVLSAPEVAGLCHVCALERIEDARKAIVSICESWPGIARGHDNGGSVALYNISAPWWVRMLDEFSPGLEIERKRAQGICDRLEKAVAEKNHDLMRRSASCKRDELKEIRGWYRFVGPQ